MGLSALCQPAVVARACARAHTHNTHTHTHAHTHTRTHARTRTQCTKRKRRLTDTGRGEVRRVGAKLRASRDLCHFHCPGPSFVWMQTVSLPRNHPSEPAAVTIRLSHTKLKILFQAKVQKKLHGDVFAYCNCEVFVNKNCTCQPLSVVDFFSVISLSLSLSLYFSLSPSPYSTFFLSHFLSFSLLFANEISETNWTQ